jgi:hypothetical protein
VEPSTTPSSSLSIPVSRLNDNSVVVEKLGGADLRRQTVQPSPDGKSIFDLVAKAVVLDIEE